MQIDGTEMLKKFGKDLSPPPNFSAVNYLAISQSKYYKKLYHILFIAWCSLRVSNVICSGMFCDAIIIMHVVPYLEKVFIVSLTSGGRNLAVSETLDFLFVPNVLVSIP